MRRSIPWVTWEVVTGMEGIPTRGLLKQPLVNAGLSTQAKIEGMHKSAWHRGNNSNVFNNQLGEPSHTPLFVDLPSA